MNKGLNKIVGKANVTKIILPVILLTLASTAQADLYFELGIEGGGDTLAGTNLGQDINTGGGVKIALGVQNEVGENGQSLSLSLGYLFDSIDASNGTAEINTLSFDAIYSIRRNNHRFGLGGSYHIGPTYKDDIAGSLPLKFEFDDALGFILQYGYTYNSGLQIGARITEMDYEVSGLSFDAGSFGIFISNGF